ncbi:MAG: hypothetical protein IPP40_13525 [bacterium]|nr:hypothetical protein [bacterium]
MTSDYVWMQTLPGKAFDVLQKHGNGTFTDAGAAVGLSRILTEWVCRLVRGGDGWLDFRSVMALRK